MNGAAQLQARTLIARLRAESAAACTALRETCARESLQLLREARSDARARRRAALRDRDAEVAARCRDARLQLEARQRAAGFAAAAAALGTGLEALPAALAARWAEPAARQRWCAAALDAARALLDPGDWTVEFAPGLSSTEVEVCARAVAADGLRAPLLVELDELGAGLRISRRGARVDASLHGLVADRESLAAALLAELEVA